LDLGCEALVLGFWVAGVLLSTQDTVARAESSPSAESLLLPGRVLLARLCLRVRLGATARGAIVAMFWLVGFGGPGAIATTVLTGLSAAVALGGVGAVEEPPAVDFGDSDSFSAALPDDGVVTLTCATEFFLL
jgi:hypothetical protein